MTSLTRRGRIQSGSSSRMQSLQQLLWTAAPSLRPGRFRGIWVMAKLAPRPLRSDRYPEGLPDLPMADQLRVSNNNLACSFVLTELQALADRGGGSVRENPLRSLYWELTQEKQMMATGPWQDTVYSACCFMGARCKAQRLRHNIDEIAQWPALHCHHTHAADEWQPYLQHGQRVFPSKEEAEYTASLAFGIAVSASWWAARMGLAKLHVPRFPFVETAGRREHWLQIDPRALREWAMASTAIAFGLRPTYAEERARTPHRTRVVDVILEDKTLPPGVVYVGRGHHSHRLPVTKLHLFPATIATRAHWCPSTVDGGHPSCAGNAPQTPCRSISFRALPFRGGK